LDLSGLGYGYGVAGRKQLAREILAELTEASKQHYIASSDFALVHAIQWLEKAYDERDSLAPFLHVDPRLARLRKNSRFKVLLRHAGAIKVAAMPHPYRAAERRKDRSHG
jgi:hypothetical protein